jgi:hypothetical protein
VTYRLNCPTLAIDTVDGTTNATVVPAGAVLAYSGEVDGLITCNWEGREVRILSNDLTERCTAVQ